MSLTYTPGTPENTAIDASSLLSPTENLSILGGGKKYHCYPIADTFKTSAVFQIFCLE